MGSRVSVAIASVIRFVHGVKGFCLGRVVWRLGSGLGRLSRGGVAGAGLAVGGRGDEGRLWLDGFLGAGVV